tara:strand:- start:89 stop:613 length:525 start_codon:yes stop_codon:yes gene_type:complete
MAETNLVGRTSQTKLNSMAVDLIDVTLLTTIDTHADGDVISQSIEIPNAVAVEGGTAIIQSIYLQNQDNDVESPALELVFASKNTNITSDIGDGVEVNDTDLITATLLGSSTVSNWSLLKPSENEIATKTNIGLVVRADSNSKSIFVHTINRSGANYTPSGTAVLKAKIGVVKD